MRSFSAVSQLPSLLDSQSDRYPQLGAVLGLGAGFASR